MKYLIAILTLFLIFILHVLQFKQLEIENKAEGKSEFSKRQFIFSVFRNLGIASYHIIPMFMDEYSKNDEFIKMEKSRNVWVIIFWIIVLILALSIWIYGKLR